jgi:hypothetical protein
MHGVCSDGSHILQLINQYKHQVHSDITETKSQGLLSKIVKVWKHTKFEELKPGLCDVIINLYKKFEQVPW